MLIDSFPSRCQFLFLGIPSEHSHSCKKSEQSIQCSAFCAENPFYISLYRVSTVRSSEWKQGGGSWVNVICLILFSVWTDDEMYAVTCKGLLSLWTSSTLRRVKRTLAWQDGRIMHPPVDLERSKHIDRGKIRVLSVLVGTASHWARPDPKQCSKFFRIWKTELQEGL